MHLERTPRGYPLPHPEHLLSEDVLNLREAIARIDADVAAQAETASQGQDQLTERLHRQQLRVFHQFGF
jgi:exonuclease VII large subunit